MKYLLIILFVVGGCSKNDKISNRDEAIMYGLTMWSNGVMCGAIIKSIHPDYSNSNIIWEASLMTNSGYQLTLQKLTCH